MDDKYSQLKRRFCLDPENILNFQLLKRRLGVLPIQLVCIKGKDFTESKTKTCNNRRTLTKVDRLSREHTEIQTAEEESWPYNLPRTQTGTGCDDWMANYIKTGSYCGR